MVTVIVCWGRMASSGHLSVRGAATSLFIVIDCGGTMPVEAGAFGACATAA
jgi:hypothetical protein